ncbi:hypothetical protein [Ruminococcus sp.]|uniref:hypothetical protein n=1 Tax=Ruminococcus sp. TaxID=41978 RepID=UPI0038672F2F
MIGKNSAPVLVDIKEDTRIARDYGTVDTVTLAIAIYNEVLKTRIGKPDEQDYKWQRACALATVFDVGRMQGIREERTRRRQTHTDSEAEALTVTA